MGYHHIWKIPKGLQRKQHPDLMWTPNQALARLQRYHKKWWMFHPWKLSRSGWAQHWANSWSGGCPCARGLEWGGPQSILRFRKPVFTAARLRVQVYLSQTAAQASLSWVTMSDLSNCQSPGIGQEPFLLDSARTIVSQPLESEVEYCSDLGRRDSSREASRISSHSLQTKYCIAN